MSLRTWLQRSCIWDSYKTHGGRQVFGTCTPVVEFICPFFSGYELAAKCYMSFEALDVLDALGTLVISARALDTFPEISFGSYVSIKP